MEQATFDDFMKLDIRVGTIVEARPFEKARRPAYQLLVDLGPELGQKRSSAPVSYTHLTLPSWRIFFLPSFCFSSSFFLREISPP